MLHGGGGAMNGGGVVLAKLTWKLKLSRRSASGIGP